MEKTIYFEMREIEPVIEKVKELLEDFVVECKIEIKEKKGNECLIRFTPKYGDELFWVGVAWCRARREYKK